MPLSALVESYPVSTCNALHTTGHASSDHLQVIVQSPDTDVAVICVHVYSAMTCHKLWYHTGVKNERRYIPIHDIVSATGPEVRQKCLVWTYVRPPVHDYLKP